MPQSIFWANDYDQSIAFGLDFFFLLIIVFKNVIGKNKISCLSNPLELIMVNSRNPITMKSTILLCCLLMFGCQAYELEDLEERTSFACNVDDATDLPWLKEMIEQAEGRQGVCQTSRVDQGTYRGETVFISYVSGALCCTCHGNAVLNCQGDLLFVCDSDKEGKIKHKKAIWQR